MGSRNREKTGSELRDFGYVMTIALLVLSAILLWKQRPSAMGTLSLSVLFFVPAVFRPSSLRIPEKYWMKFAEKLSTVMTFLIMTLTFFGAVLPIGLLLRLLGKDLIGRFPPKMPFESYWIPVEVDGHVTRPMQPF